MKRKIILWLCAVFFFILIISAFSVDVNFRASATDLGIYRAAGSSIFIIAEMGLLVELDLFHIKSKIPLVKGNTIGKHILFWVILTVIAIISFSVINSFTSKEFRLALGQEHDSKANGKQQDITELLKTEDSVKEHEDIELNTINTEDSAKEHEDIALNTEDSVSEAPNIESGTTSTEFSDGRTSEIEPERIGKEPVSFIFDDEYIVGNVKVHINEIQIRQEPFKVGSKILEFRIFLDITNDTSSEQFFSATRTGNEVGVYYDSDESHIGGMDNLIWDKEDYIVTTGTTVPANENKEIVVQAGAITTEPVYYGDEIKFDIFLRNSDTLFTVSFTCNFAL